MRIGPGSVPIRLHARPNAPNSSNPATDFVIFQSLERIERQSTRLGRTRPYNRRALFLPACDPMSNANPDCTFCTLHWFFGLQFNSGHRLISDNSDYSDGVFPRTV